MIIAINDRQRREDSGDASARLCLPDREWAWSSLIITITLTITIALLLLRLF